MDGGLVILDLAYLDMMVALLLSPVFLIFPMRAADRTLPSPVYDVALFLISFGTACYLAWNATNAVEGWEYFSPAHAQYAAIMLWVLLIEGVAGRLH